MFRRSIFGATAFLLFCLAAQGVEFSRRSYECAPNQTFFVSGFQRFASLKNGDGDVNARFNPTAGAIGYVYNQGLWHAGAAVSYEYGTRKYNYRTVDADYRVRSSMPGVSLFGGMTTPNGWYVDTAAFLGFGSYKAKDFDAMIGGVPVHSGSGNRQHNTAFAASIEAGRNFNLGSDFLLTPHLGFDYAYTSGESYRFTNGATTYRMADIDSQNYFEMPLGVSFSKMFYMGAWTLTPKVDLTMVNSFGKMDTMNAQPGFAYRTAKGWRVAGIGGDHVGGRVTAGMDAKLGDRTSIGLDYTYEARKSYHDHRISAMFGLAF